MAYAYKVTVYRRQVAALFQRGGQGYRWLDGVKRSMFNACVASAPVRSGTIKRSHRSDIRGLNQYACIATISNVAGHAEWVHEGVPGMIYPDGDFLSVPIAPGSRRRFRAKAVRGQKANPWIARACSAIAISKGAVPRGG